MTKTVDTLYEEVAKIIGETALNEKDVNKVIGVLLTLAGYVIAIEYVRMECLDKGVINQAISRAEEQVRRAVNYILEHREYAEWSNISELLP